jgi:surfeit locus 1 family protein
MTGSTARGEDQVMQETGPRRRSFATLAVLATCAALAFAGFVALGTWQLKRLQWKLALIERVEQRVHAAPVPAPGPDRWPQVSAESDEYRRVRVEGSYLYGLTAKVQAVTELGSGYWLLTPLRKADGSVVLINRGFIPAQEGSRVGRVGDGDQSPQAGADAGASIVTGLLRISEPGGGFLRRNDPAADRWYSRDVAAIAASRGMSGVAPYFIDADVASAAREKSTGPAPVGGLTVISFHNNHLVYALTWYALALMVAGGYLWVMREERRLRRRSTGSGAHYIDQDGDNARQN